MPEQPTSDRGTLSKALPYLIWITVIALFVLLVWSTDYVFRDADSKLYSNLAQELAARPVTEWVAPYWGGNWDREELFREHPPGAFYVSAALIRLGAPPRQAAGIANYLYYLLGFLCIYAIGKHVRDRGIGWAMVWAAFLIPVTLQYIIRGNLEPPLTMATLLGMYGILRADRSWLARLGFAVALTFAVFVKGMQGTIVVIFAGVYWILWSRDATRFYTILAGTVIMLGVCGLFEWAYRAHTGEGFWLQYMYIQSSTAVKSHSVLTKFYTLFWYICRAIYFAIPWTVFLMLARWRRPPGTRTYPPEVVWRWFMVSAAVLIVIMAFFERKADRYIFPSYTLIAMAGGWYVYDRFARVRRWFTASNLKCHLVFAAAVLLAAALKVLSANKFYHPIQFWRH
jgi:4-amino-4-deoxy-L-arabinose transferase-like glycosyltransferase